MVYGSRRPCVFKPFFLFEELRFRSVISYRRGIKEHRKVEQNQESNTGNHTSTEELIYKKQVEQQLIIKFKPPNTIARSRKQRLNTSWSFFGHPKGAQWTASRSLKPIVHRPSFYSEEMAGGTTWASTLTSDPQTQPVFKL